MTRRIILKNFMLRTSVGFNQFCFTVAALLLSASLHNAVAAPSSNSCAASVRHASFDYHSNFLLNLHHFLFNAARHPDDLDQFGKKLTSDENTKLQAAIGEYRNNYIKRDPLFDDGMTGIKEVLSQDDTRTTAQGLDLPIALVTALNDAAPIYARVTWPQQDASNKRWIANLQALDSAYGNDIQAGIECALGGTFPAHVRVDAVVQTGTFEGAYTSEAPPHSVFPTGRSDYSQLASLEMLYHEATHAGVSDQVAEDIEAAAKLAHREPGQLWHAVHFYTVGEVVRQVLKKRAGIDYLPYADSGGLWNRAWPAYRKLIDADWVPYMRDERSMNSAVVEMVKGLPEAP